MTNRAHAARRWQFPWQSHRLRYCPGCCPNHRRYQFHQVGDRSRTRIPDVLRSDDTDWRRTFLIGAFQVGTRDIHNRCGIGNTVLGARELGAYRAAGDGNSGGSEDKLISQGRFSRRGLIVFIDCMCFESYIRYDEYIKCNILWKRFFSNNAIRFLKTS